MHIASAKLASASGFKDKSEDAILDNADHASLTEEGIIIYLAGGAIRVAMCLKIAPHSSDKLSKKHGFRWTG